MSRLRNGDRVLYRPQQIGYGYMYGLDDGIPAIVDGWFGEWSQITFYSKRDDGPFTRRVKTSNLVLQEPRR